VTSTLSFDAEPPSCEATASDAPPGWATQQRPNPAVMHRGIGFASSLSHQVTSTRSSDRIRYASSVTQIVSYRGYTRVTSLLDVGLSN
jgi:hypothetical protein